MPTKTLVYVGELIRKEIRDRKIRNGFAIDILHKAGFTKISDVTFSQKIYGEKNQFTQEEVDALNAAWGTTFKV